MEKRKSHIPVISFSPIQPPNDKSLSEAFPVTDACNLDCDESTEKSGKDDAPGEITTLSPLPNKTGKIVEQKGSCGAHNSEPSTSPLQFKTDQQPESQSSILNRMEEQACISVPEPRTNENPSSNENAKSEELAMLAAESAPVNNEQQRHLFARSDTRPSRTWSTTDVPNTMPTSPPEAPRELLFASPSPEREDETQPITYTQIEDDESKQEEATNHAPIPSCVSVRNMKCNSRNSPIIPEMQKNSSKVKSTLWSSRKSPTFQIKKKLSPTSRLASKKCTFDFEGDIFDLDNCTIKDTSSKTSDTSKRFQPITDEEDSQGQSIESASEAPTAESTGEEQENSANISSRNKEEANKRKATIVAPRRLSPLMKKSSKARMGGGFSGSLGRMTVTDILNSTRSPTSSNLSPEENLKQHQDMLKLFMDELSALHFENEVLNLKINQLEQDHSAQLWEMEYKKQSVDAQLAQLEEETREQTADTECMIAEMKLQLEKGLKKAMSRIKELENELETERGLRKSLQESKNGSELGTEGQTGLDSLTEA